MKNIISRIWLPLLVVFLTLAFIAYLGYRYVKYVELDKSIHYYKDSFTEEEAKEVKEYFDIQQDCDYELKAGLLTTEYVVVELECDDELQNIWQNMFGISDLTESQITFNPRSEYDCLDGTVIPAMQLDVSSPEPTHYGASDIYVWVNEEKHYQISIRDYSKPHSAEIWEMFELANNR